MAHEFKTDLGAGEVRLRLQLALAVCECAGITFRALTLEEAAMCSLIFW